MRWKRKGWRKRIETAEAGLRGKLAVGLRPTLRGILDCTLKPALKLPIFVAAVPAGPVPVPIKVSLIVKPIVEARLATEVEGRVEVRMKGFAGVEYDGESMHPKGTVSPKLTTELPTFRQDMSVSVGVAPTVNIQAGWGGRLGKLAAVAELSFPTTLRVGFKPGPHSVPQACVPVRTLGAIHFHLPIRKHPFSASSSELKLFEKCRELNGQEGEVSRRPGAAEG